MWQLPFCVSLHRPAGMSEGVRCQMVSRRSSLRLSEPRGARQPSWQRRSGLCGNEHGPTQALRTRRWRDTDGNHKTLVLPWNVVETALFATGSTWAELWHLLYCAAESRSAWCRSLLWNLSRLLVKQHDCAITFQVYAQGYAPSLRICPFKGTWAVWVMKKISGCACQHQERPQYSWRISSDSTGVGEEWWSLSPDHVSNSIALNCAILHYVCSSLIQT